MVKKFDLRLPVKVTNPVVFTSAHSGCEYSQAFLDNSLLDDLLIRSSEDAFVDALYKDLVDFGSPQLCATAPRAYVDLNRGPDEMDPAIIEGSKRASSNPRVAAGLGVIPRVVSEGRAIQCGKITREAAEARLDEFYHPFHNLLSELLTQAKRRFGVALLIDCHSMPNDAVQNAIAPGGARPDIILGNRFGASASVQVFDLVEAAFKAQGFAVGRNTPFAGGYITKKYGAPSRSRHVVQVEVNRALYMNETTVSKNQHFDDISKRLIAASKQICTDMQPLVQLAAE